jgi:3-oxoacyl-[acyl-carrier-protein] synthase II
MSREFRGRPRDDSQRVVVTGLGAITPLGLTVADYWQGLLAGRSGVRRITQFNTDAYPTKIAGTVNGFDPGNYMDRKQARRVSRFAQLAVAAAAEGLKDSGLDLERADRDQCGVLMGCGIGGLDDTEANVRVMLDKGGMRISPFFIVTIPPNLAAFQIAYTFGLRGYNNTVCTACAAGSQAIGEASEVIRRGQADVLVAGGCEGGLCELALAAFCVGKAYSTRNDEPEKACRPFDKDRDGFVAGEGAGVLVLERLTHARERGARIYCEVVGYGASSDAYHLIAPDPTGAGAARAMRGALQSAGLPPEAIDYINAHAAGTVLGDVAETIAMKLVFGERAYQIPISATKSMIGHLWGGAGGAEAIATIKAIETGWVHPTINLDMPDPECDLDYVPWVARQVQVDIGMSNNFGLGGQNASVIFARYEE